MPFDLEFSLICCSIIVTVTFILHVFLPLDGTYLASGIVLDTVFGGDGGAQCFFSFLGFSPYYLQRDFM